MYLFDQQKINILLHKTISKGSSQVYGNKMPVDKRVIFHLKHGKTIVKDSWLQKLRNFDRTFTKIHLLR